MTNREGRDLLQAVVAGIGLSAAITQSLGVLLIGFLMLCLLVQLDRNAS